MPLEYQCIWIIFFFLKRRTVNQTSWETWLEMLGAVSCIFNFTWLRHHIVLLTELPYNINLVKLNQDVYFNGLPSFKTQLVDFHAILKLLKKKTTLCVSVSFAAVNNLNHPGVTIKNKNKNKYNGTVTSHFVYASNWVT